MVSASPYPMPKTSKETILSDWYFKSLKLSTVVKVNSMMGDHCGDYARGKEVFWMYM